jgi:hypothetical protein
VALWTRKLREESDPSSVVVQAPTAAPTSSPTAAPTFEPTAVRHGHELFMGIMGNKRSHQCGMHSLPLADSDGGAHRIADRRAHALPHGGAHGGAHERE